MRTHEGLVDHDGTPRVSDKLVPIPEGRYDENWSNRAGKTLNGLVQYKTIVADPWKGRGPLVWASAPAFDSYGRVDSWRDTSGQADRYGRRGSSETGEGGRASCRRRWWSTSGLGSRPGAKACECRGSRLSGLATASHRLQCDHSFTGSCLTTLLSGRCLRELAGVFILLVGYCRIRCGLRVVGCCRFCCCHMAAGFRFGYSTGIDIPPLSCCPGQSLAKP